MDGPGSDEVDAWVQRAQPSQKIKGLPLQHAAPCVCMVDLPQAEVRLARHDHQSRVQGGPAFGTNPNATRNWPIADSDSSPSGEVCEIKKIPYSELARVIRGEDGEAAPCRNDNLQARRASSKTDLGASTSASADTTRPYSPGAKFL